RPPSHRPKNPPPPHPPPPRPGAIAKMLARLVLNEQAYGEAFSVCTSEHHPWQYMADIYKSAIGLETRICTMQDYKTKIHQGHYSQLLYDRMYNRVMDNSKVLAVTGLTQSDLTPLDTALRRELATFPNIKSGINVSQCASLDRLLNTKTPLDNIGKHDKMCYFIHSNPALKKTYYFAKKNKKIIKSVMKRILPQRLIQIYKTFKKSHYTLVFLPPP
ncbi:MAG: hypothetical protein LBT32_05545, partial [Peptococcaceae bacterium]|nr:hypothetical protein [Peptococcaceae bacterium]